MGMDTGQKLFFKTLHKCIMAHLPYGSKLHIPPTNCHLLAAQQKPYIKTEGKKSLTLNKKCWRIFRKKSECTISRKMRTQSKRTYKNETGDRIGESNDTLRFHTEGTHQIFLITLSGGGSRKETRSDFT